MVYHCCTNITFVHLFKRCSRNAINNYSAASRSQQINANDMTSDFWLPTSSDFILLQIQKSQRISPHKSKHLQWTPREAPCGNPQPGRLRPLRPLRRSHPSAHPYKSELLTQAMCMWRVGMSQYREDLESVWNAWLPDKWSMFYYVL